MTHRILDPLSLYLNGDIDLDTFENRVIILIWDNDFKDQALLDEILCELIYFKDGLTDEPAFRERVAEAARRTYTDPSASAS